MKRILLPLVLIISLIACNQKPEGYVINGTLRGEVSDSTQVILKKIGENNKPVSVDTVLTSNGTYTFTGKPTTPELHYIFIDNLPGYTVVVLEDGEIEISAQKDSLNFAKIKGTVQNDIFSDYMEKSIAMSNRAKSIQKDLQKANVEKNDAVISALSDEMKELQEEHKSFELDYIKANPNGLISALLIDKAIASRVVPTEEIKALYEGLSPEIKANKVAKSVLEKITALEEKASREENTTIGKKAPDFSAKNPEGKEVSLNNVLGKITLIDFWAAWCKPCRAENPNVLAVYKKYHDKGLNIIGVSLDKDGEQWKKAILDDKLEWDQVSNLAYFNDEIAKLYNVDAIPAAFLLDENGVIIAKNLRGDALEQKVSELLN
ncbi:TlpA disulfide reductase family protein [uncultured Maribacter sp.]|uniref:TlpA disulfide reductase family protein n=1 Tax=uncultured Maribacter sp. TaxID=431308 RepID=UPI0026023A5E|nr:TlpA disulfide reductase family protein [uncultured Maribacter sp.]